MKQKKKDFSDIYFEDAYKGMYNIFIPVVFILYFIMALPFFLYQQVIKLIEKIFKNGKTWS